MYGLTEEKRLHYQSDLELILNGHDAEENAAWQRLLTLVRRLSLNWARHRYRLANEDAEDVAQIVQIRVVQRVSQLRNPDAFLGWIRRLVHHAVVDHVRRSRNSLSLDVFLGDDGDAPPDADADAMFEQIVLRADLNRALECLPESCREPIELHLLHGLPQDEIGRMLGRPRSTVASQIMRGLRRMERVLAGLNAHS